MDEHAKEEGTIGRVVSRRQRLARRVLDDAGRRQKLLHDAEKKLQQIPDDPQEATAAGVVAGGEDTAENDAGKMEQLAAALRELKRYIGDLIRLVRAYASDEYRELETETLILIVVAIVYFVNPFDLVPDPLPVVGHLDDLAVVMFVVGIVKDELEKFEEWEAGGRSAEDAV